MSKMGDEYLRQMERQFGDVRVSYDTPCYYCGQRYGDHYGLECPEPISPYEIPHIACDKHFNPPNEVGNDKETTEEAKS